MICSAACGWCGRCTEGPATATCHRCGREIPWTKEDAREFPRPACARGEGCQA